MQPSGGSVEHSRLSEQLTRRKPPAPVGVETEAKVDQDVQDGAEVQVLPPVSIAALVVVIVIVVTTTATVTQVIVGFAHTHAPARDPLLVRVCINTAMRNPGPMNPPMRQQPTTTADGESVYPVGGGPAHLPRLYRPAKRPGPVEPIVPGHNNRPQPRV
ncbi:hypothetical protein BJ085DRAFT_29163 [Dimargaris cristalligena]|uniref:Uncharacterized protein n=1 Tax=Dimargaris cristalligena TaxID=215637 RepID=A0A4P9ZX77_9FUNG|nr:hypothetical protein BJ085DRAFT_29163 [Dimargaris cristalligena]|eukprot:RKP38295.1 hypothetical protein BJ085DRAFT_29163 [Dimargaris cristalligena]